MGVTTRMLVSPEPSVLGAGGTFLSSFPTNPSESYRHLRQLDEFSRTVVRWIASTESDGLCRLISRLISPGQSGSVSRTAVGLTVVRQLSVRVARD